MTNNRLAVNLSNPSSETTPQTDELSSESSSSSTENNSMEEFHQLQKTLYLVTLGMSVIIFISVWVFYSLNTGLNYAIGACAGMVYLKMLARDVQRLGVQKNRLGSGRLAPFIGLIVLATQLQKLQILPIFLGFMTYKAAILVYVLQTTIVPAQK
ncbi:MAG: ATP synthase subunit I [Oscillatoria sp. PMC 1068.18]|nr:ATP synthase subunit I [Oscillatoria sp. PMC 1068.18]